MAGCWAEEGEGAEGPGPGSHVRRSLASRRRGCRIAPASSLVRERFLRHGSQSWNELWEMLRRHRLKQQREGSAPHTHVGNSEETLGSPEALAESCPHPRPLYFTDTDGKSSYQETSRNLTCISKSVARGTNPRHPSLLEAEPRPRAELWTPPPGSPHTQG